jgi:hypothetical protein
MRWVNLSLTLPCFKDERHPFPPRIVDPQCCSSIGWADGVGRDGIVIEIARLAIGGNVLAKKRLFASDGWNATQNFDLRKV